MEPVEPLQSDFTAVGTNCLSPKFFSPFCHRWSFGSLPLLPLACLVGDTSFPAISSTWLHRYYLNWTEMDDAITKLNNENRIENWVLNLVILHYWHTIFLFWYCAVALLQFVLLKRYINKRDLTWSFPGASGRSRSLPHVSGNSAPWGNFHGWFMLFLWGHGHLGVPLLLPRCSVSPGTWGGAVSGGVRGDLRVTVRASPRGVPHPSSTLQLVGMLLERAEISAEPGTPPVSFNAPPDDQMSIAASEGELSLFQGWQTGCVTPFGCGSIVWARPRDDGNAFPGCRVCQACVESSTASRSFKVGRVVSRWGSRWFSASPPGAILPGSAWGAHKIVECTFHCSKRIL